MTTKDAELALWCQNLMYYCLFKDEELIEGRTPDNAILVEGVMSNFGFHPGRVAEKKPEIKELLDLMPAPFHAQSGGGWSFTQLCMDKDGNQWTGFHRAMEALVVLGIAAGMASFPAPREMWHSLPLSMPYVTFDTRDKTTEPPKEESHEQIPSGVGEQSPGD